MLNNSKSAIRRYLTLLFLLFSLFSCEKIKQGEKMKNEVDFGSDFVPYDSQGSFIKIKSDNSWNISLTFKDGDPQWCSVNPDAGKGSKSNITLLYSVNNGQEQRSVDITVTFSDGEKFDFTLTQASKENGDRPDPDPDPEPDDSVRVNCWMELPVVDTTGGVMFVSHYTEIGGKNVRNYSLGFDTRNRIALWVAYPLCSDYIGKQSRTDEWAYDPKIPQEYQPALYKGWPERGYDRGHQIPSGSRNKNYTTNAQTFYYSNMTAQVSSFNQNLWAKCEGMVRGYSSTCDTLYVVTGPVLTTTSFSSISYTNDNLGNEVAVPKAYYKVLLKYNISSSSYSAIGYYFENKPYDRSEPIQSDLYTVAEIEKMTGLTFFPNLPEEIADKVKNQYEPSKWGL